MGKKRNQNNKAAKGRSSGASRSGSGGGRGFYLLLGGLAIAGIAALVLVRDSGGKAPLQEPLSLAETTAPASADAGVALGAKDAPVTIVEFADFQCPHCRTFNSLTGKAIRRDYAGADGPVRWINYDFPLNQASWAPALAARCGEQQGRYWQMHDMIYAMSDTWMRKSNPNKAFMKLANTVGLDEDAFRACLADRSALRDIGAARRYGESLGVNSTPTLFINGRQVPPRQENFTYAGLEKLIRQELEEVPATGSD